MKLCSIASGSSGNCIFAGSETTSLLIDAGISGKRVEAGLAVLDRSAKELDGILVTHEHSDHILGLGVLARRYGIPIYATDGTIQAMQQTKSLGKFPEGIFHTIHADDTFTLGDIAVHPFTISHDAAEPGGYRMESGGKSIAIATDLGVYSDYTVQNLTGLDAVLLEANHDENMLAVGPYPYPLKQRIAGAKGRESGRFRTWCGGTRRSMPPAPSTATGRSPPGSGICSPGCGRRRWSSWKTCWTSWSSRISARWPSSWASAERTGSCPP